MMMKAQDIMTTDVVTIRGSATVAEAVAMMNELCLRALIVERLHEQDAGVADLRYESTFRLMLQNSPSRVL